MSTPFTSLSCAIRYDNARILTWTLNPKMDYPGDFILRVENSRAGGPWETLSDTVKDSCCYIDTRKRSYNKRLDETYRLVLDIPSTGEQYISPIVDAGNHMAYPYSADAENILKQVTSKFKLDGCPGMLLKRKLWGTRCPSCVDFSGQQSVNEHCPRCFGTGIDGGYFPGIPLTILRDSTSMVASPSQAGYLQGEAVDARCIFYPFVCVDDIWCEDNTNNRYRIAQVTPIASYKTTHLIASVKLLKIEYTDISYAPVIEHLVVNNQDSYDFKDDTLLL